MVRHILQLLALAVALAGAGATGAAADCLSPNQARSAAQQGQVMPLYGLIGSIKAATGGEILPPAQLCQNGGRYVYVVNVLQPNGQVKKITVDAASGNIVGQ